MGRRFNGWFSTSDLAEFESLFLTHFVPNFVFQSQRLALAREPYSADKGVPPNFLKMFKTGVSSSLLVISAMSGKRI